jgi:hypothetical protein
MAQQSADSERTRLMIRLDDAHFQAVLEALANDDLPYLFSEFPEPEEREQ